MSCTERGLISGYLDDALSPRQKDNLLAHLDQCPDCAQTLARYRQMELLLRRLPAREPMQGSRDKLLRCMSARSRWSRWRWTRAIAAAALLTATGLGISASREIPPAPNATQVSVLTAPGSAPAVSAAQETGAVEARQPLAQSVENASNAALLQQVSRSLRRPGFRPLLPGYLPKGARLANVNLRPNNPGGPIDRLELAFDTTGNRLQLHQESADAASFETQRMFRASSQRLLTAGGHEWLYIRRDFEGSPGTAVLIGSRDGIVIWLESSLPLEEMEKIAASLQD